jgi:hypothetical protein
MCVTPEVERVVIAAAEGARQSEKPTATESCSLGKFGWLGMLFTLQV